MQTLMSQNEKLIKAQELKSEQRNGTLPTTRRKEGDKKADGKQYCKCGNCNIILCHEDNGCYELECNVHRCPKDWKSVQA